MNTTPRTVLNVTLIVAAFAVLALNVYAALQPPVHAAGSFNPTGAGTYLLQSSVSATQSTITLTSFTEPTSNIPYTMSYIGTDVIYGTINPSSGNSEFISASGITQNTNGTATLTGVTRGLSRTPGTGGCVASTTLAHAYAGQTQFILSNPPCFYEEFAIKKNDQTFAGINTFTVSPIVNDANSTSTAQAASRAYVLNTAIQGAGTSTETSMGISQLANAAQVGFGTASSTTGAPLVIPNKFATSSPGTLCTGGTIRCIVAAASGKIAQSWLDLTAAFTVTGAWVFNAATTFDVAPTFGTFSATSTTATSSITANLTVGNNASTTNLFISTKCTGCISSYETITNTGAGPTSIGTTAAVTATCTTGKKVIGCGASDGGGTVALNGVNPSGANSCVATYVNYGGAGANTMTAYAICVNP